jgi:hypothetical protein
LLHWTWRELKNWINDLEGQEHIYNIGDPNTVDDPNWITRLPVPHGDFNFIWGSFSFNLSNDKILKIPYLNWDIS